MPFFWLREAELLWGGETAKQVLFQENWTVKATSRVIRDDSFLN
jgi:hypothetical protein